MEALAIYSRDRNLNQHYKACAANNLLIFHAILTDCDSGFRLKFTSFMFSCLLACLLVFYTNQPFYSDFYKVLVYTGRLYPT